MVAVAVVVIAVLLRLLVIDWYAVTSDSMSPTVRAGETVVVDHVGWRATDLARGDLVTFASPEDGALTLKRVVALAGDEVRIDDAVLVVGGTPVVEQYVDASRIDATYFGPVVVPAGHVFVMGDNRFGSTDSRVYGAVALDDVTGRVLITLR